MIVVARNLVSHGTMSYRCCMLVAGLLGLQVASGQTPETLVLEGIPPFSAELKAAASRYLEFRAAAFLDWHPQRREMLIGTRFADTAQLHAVKFPGGAQGKRI